MVLHTCAHTAPHALIDLRVDAVALGAQRGEIDVAASGGVLCGEDMVPHGILVEVHILGIASTVGEHLGQFQHIVGVARLWAVELVDITVAVGGS